MILHAASLRGRTWFLFFFLVILSFDLFGGGKGAATEQIEVIAGEWDEVNDVRKLYDTPVGAVYEFGLSLSWNCTPYFESGTWQIGAREHEKNCKCDICRKMRSGIKGVLLASLGKRALKRKRFVVLDFKIRAFPAIASNQTSSFQFQIVRSGETKIKSNYGDVTGILFSGSSLLRSFSTEFIQPPNFWIIRTEGFPYRPDFGLYSCRIIFNTYTGNNLTVIRNGYHVIFLQPEAPAPRLPIEINSLGIISQDRGGNKGNRREYLEISSPVIYRFNSEALLQELPAQDVVAYPYDAYLLKDSKDRPVPAGQEWRKVKGSKNPDLQYAYALRWLYGDECNPSRAIDLLEEAAKEKHALADYELGVCYYRGYGVTPNEKKADRYLKEAETFGYSKAAVLRSMIFWEQHNRPKFYDRKSWNDSMVEMIEASGKSIEHDNSVFYSFFSDVQDSFIFEYSPKRFHLGFWMHHRHLFSNFPDADEIVGRHMEQNRNSGYIPAYLTEAQYLEFRKKDRKEVIRLLRAGSNAGDLECRSKLLLVLAEAGELPKEMFNAENDLLFSDDPVYLMFEYALKHPGEPGIAEFLAADREGAARIWARKSSAEAGYLSALLTWSRVYPYRHRHGVPHRRKKVGDSVEMEQIAAMRRDEENAAAAGFEQLKIAAKAGIPSAMYLVARQYGNCDYPADDEVTSDPLAKLAGEAWMKKAAEAGHAKARFQMLQWESMKAMISRLEQMLPEVEEFCRINYSPAFLLKAEILDRLNRSAEAVAAYETAASRGEYQAWRVLALKQEKLKHESAANELWKKFIAADREHRKQDRYDVFYPQIKIDTKLQPWMMSPDEIQQYRERLEKIVGVEIMDD